MAPLTPCLCSVPSLWALGLGGEIFSWVDARLREHSGGVVGMTVFYAHSGAFFFLETLHTLHSSRATNLTAPLFRRARRPSYFQTPVPLIVQRLHLSFLFFFSLCSLGLGGESFLLFAICSLLSVLSVLSVLSGEIFSWVDARLREDDS